MFLFGHWFHITKTAISVVDEISPIVGWCETLGHVQSPEQETILGAPHCKGTTWLSACRHIWTNHAGPLFWAMAIFASNWFLIFRSSLLGDDPSTWRFSGAKPFAQPGWCPDGAPPLCSHKGFWLRTIFKTFVCRRYKICTLEKFRIVKINPRSSPLFTCPKNKHVDLLEMSWYIPITHYLITALFSISQCRYIHIYSVCMFMYHAFSQKLMDTEIFCWPEILQVLKFRDLLQFLE